MTLCVLSGRDLRHVHHAFNAGFLGGLGEEGGSLNDPGTDGVAKVSPCDASKRRSDVIQVEKITEHDFGTQPLEPLRPVGRALPGLAALLIITHPRKPSVGSNHDHAVAGRRHRRTFASSFAT
jgi:hypothetical protein